MNVVCSVFVLTPTNGATVTQATMIGCGMVEKLLRRNISLSGLCTLVTPAIHWIGKRGDTALAHLNVTGTYSLTTWSHLGTIFSRQIAMFNSRFMIFTNFLSLFFRRDDAVIELPTFDMGLSGDIYFEFKTTAEKTMIIIHSQGDNGDFIKVSLIGGNHIQFEYDSGKGPQGVTVETAYR